MEFIRQQITNLTSISIAARFDDYNPEKTYTIETDVENLTSASVARVGNYYYRSLSPSNKGNNPPDTLRTHWMKLSASNRFAGIDLQSRTKTISEGSDLAVEFERGTIDTFGIGYFEASSIKIEHLNSTGDVIDMATQTLTFSVNEGVIDAWTYIYAPYSTSVERNVLVRVKPIGLKIRITFAQGQNNRAAYGFLIGGRITDMGLTSINVDFSFKSFDVDTEDEFGTTQTVKRVTQDLVRFQTEIKREEATLMIREAKAIYGEVVLFVVDPSESSINENMLTLGKVKSVTSQVTTSLINFVKWTIKENL
ncbi:hypothetical protein [Sulfurimonas sp.]